MMVYLLSHARADDPYRDHEKLIGVYSSEAAAKGAISRLQDKPGFRDHIAGFEIGEFTVDRDQGWSDGFISWDEATPPR